MNRLAEAFRSWLPAIVVWSAAVGLGLALVAVLLGPAE